MSMGLDASNGSSAAHEPSTSPGADRSPAGGRFDVPPAGRPAAPDPSGKRPTSLGIINAFNASHKDAVRLYKQTRRASQGAHDTVGHAAAAVAAETVAQTAHDLSEESDTRRHGPLPRRYLAVIAAVALDAIACYLAAQVFGGDQTSTLLVTALLLAGLAGGEIWLDFTSRRAHQQPNGAGNLAWQAVACGLGLFVIALGVLRYDYLLTVDGNVTSALLGAVLLSVITGGLVVLGYLTLRGTESVDMFIKRRRARRAERATQAAQAAILDADRDRNNLAKRYLSQIQPTINEAADDQEHAQQLEAGVRRNLESYTVTTPAPGDTRPGR
jgi:hypothetical protein